MNKQTTTYIKRLRGIQATVTESLMKHTITLMDNPSHAMEWGDHVFSLAARDAIVKQLLAALDDGDHSVTLQTALEILQENHRNAARYINNYSTSPAKNLMSQHRLAELTQEIEFLERFIRFDKKD